MTKDQDLRETAPLLARLVPAGEAEALEALAFLLRNRAQAAARGSARAALRGLELRKCKPSAREEAAYAALRRAFAGAGPDVTAGATRLHRHDEAPSWAGPMIATALIGPFLFLAAAPPLVSQRSM